jgi:hypothetical protein
MEHRELSYLHSELIAVLSRLDDTTTALKADVKRTMRAMSMSDVEALINYASTVKLNSPVSKRKNKLLQTYAREVNDFRPLQFFMAQSDLASSLHRNPDSTRPYNESADDSETSSSGALMTGRRMQRATLTKTDALFVIRDWNDRAKQRVRCTCETKDLRPFELTRSWTDVDSQQWLCESADGVCGHCRKLFLCAAEYNAATAQADAVVYRVNNRDGVPDTSDIATVDINVVTVRDFMESGHAKISGVWDAVIATFRELNMVRALDRTTSGATRLTPRAQPAETAMEHFRRAYATVARGYRRQMTPSAFGRTACRPIVASVFNRLFNMLEATISARATNLSDDAREERRRTLRNERPLASPLRGLSDDDDDMSDDDDPIDDDPDDIDEYGTMLDEGDARATSSSSSGSEWSGTDSDPMDD